jgi:magnesium-transporting ATPase (P-type)
LGAWLPALIVVAVLVLAFEVWMIVNAATNDKLIKKAKTWWIIGMVLVHPIVAIVYFFTARQKATPKPQKAKKKK